MKKEFMLWIFAFMMSLAWVACAGIYDYKDSNWLLFGINFFPVLLWTVGLVVYRKLFDAGSMNLWQMWVFYIFALLIIEYIGYHVMGIQLDSDFSGVFGTDILHVPFFAKIWYLSAGPIYLAVTDRLNGAIKK